MCTISSCGLRACAVPWLCRRMHTHAHACTRRCMHRMMPPDIQVFALPWCLLSVKRIMPSCGTMHARQGARLARIVRFVCNQEDSSVGPGCWGSGGTRTWRDVGLGVFLLVFIATYVGWRHASAMRARHSSVRAWVCTMCRTHTTRASTYVFLNHVTILCCCDYLCVRNREDYEESIITYTVCLQTW